MSTLQVYRASAGSGKTYQLALKYITLLLGRMKGGRLYLFNGADLRRHREILAITFTNKATQEMRSRIVRELSLLADPNAESDYRRSLHLLVAPEDVTCSDADIDRSICLAAGRALDSMLFDLGEMQVSTIDAFFQRVLRSFAYEADLAGNYELMLENDVMTDMAISDMLAHACGMKGVVVPSELNNGYLRERVKSLIESEVAQGHEYKLFSPDSVLRSDLIKFIKHLSGEDYLSKKDEIEQFLSKPGALVDFVRALKSRRKDLLGSLATAVQSVSDSVAAACLSSNSVKLLEKLSCGNLDGLTSSNITLLFVTEEFRKMLNKNKLQEDELTDFETRMRAVVEVMRIVKSIDAILDNTRFVGLFRETLLVQQKLKSHLNTILLSDTNELLHRIIDNSDTPFIYERIGRRLRHFLIDEFQDTSKMQWSNLLPLLSDSLGSGNDNLIIGDVKQCIYRFRNSSPELLATDIDREPRVCSFIEHCALEDNWRSAPVVVDFNNELFERAGRRADVDGLKAEAYNYVAQRPRRQSLSGYVDIDMVPEKEVDAAYDRMIQHISRQIASGYSPGDIVVLVRTNGDARDCVNVLLDAELNGRLPEGTTVVSDEALYVSSARSVRWIVSRLHEMSGMPACENSHNSRGVRRATAEDIDWLQENLLNAQASGNTERSLEDVIALFNEHRSGNETTHKRLVQASGETIFELVEQLIRELPDETLRKTEAQYLCAFQDLVVDYCRHKSPTLQGFLKQWDDEWSKKAAVGLAEGVNAIRVMTIHKSKGLEFKCVHIPLVKKSLDRDKNNRWYEVGSFLDSLDLGVECPRYYPLAPGGESSGSSLSYTRFAAQFKELRDDQTIDELNVLYVAFTRACRELIVTILDPRSNSAKNKGVDLPLNHPSGLLCPIIRDMAGNCDGPWRFGEPTSNAVESRNESKLLTTHWISSYDVGNRAMIWSQTKAAAMADSGEKV